MRAMATEHIHKRQRDYKFYSHSYVQYRPTLVVGDFVFVNRAWNNTATLSKQVADIAKSKL